VQKKIVQKKFKKCTENRYNRKNTENCEHSSYCMCMYKIKIVWEPKLNHASNAFISNLPSILINPSPKKSSDIKPNIRNICQCRQSCHSSPKAAWIKNVAEIKSIFYDAISSHVNINKLNHTLVTATDFSTLQPYTVMPFVPDVAIHYRCRDNFIRPYGFLPFTAISDNIALDGAIA